MRQRQKQKLNCIERGTTILRQKISELEVGRAEALHRLELVTAQRRTSTAGLCESNSSAENAALPNSAGKTVPGVDEAESSTLGQAPDSMAATSPDPWRMPYEKVVSADVSSSVSGIRAQQDPYNSMGVPHSGIRSSDNNNPEPPVLGSNARHPDTFHIDTVTLQDGFSGGTPDHYSEKFDHNINLLNSSTKSTLGRARAMDPPLVHSQKVARFAPRAENEPPRSASTSHAGDTYAAKRKLGLVDPCSEQTRKMVDSEKAQRDTMLNFAQKRMKMRASVNVGGHSLSNLTSTKSQGSSNVDAEDNPASMMKTMPTGITRVADGHLARSVDNLLSTSSLGMSSLPAWGEGANNGREANQTATSRQALGRLSDNGNESRNPQEKDKPHQLVKDQHMSPPCGRPQNDFVPEKMNRRKQEKMRKALRKKKNRRANQNCACESLHELIIKGRVAYPTMATFKGRLSPVQYQRNITQVAKCPFHKQSLIEWCQAVVAQVRSPSLVPSISFCCVLTKNNAA